VELQDWLYAPDRSRWFDWVGVAQYSLHFVLPVAAGFWLWLDSRRLYWRYLLAVLLLFLIGFAGYALYPAAPPWMAASFERTPQIHRIMVDTLLRLPAAEPVGLAYTRMSPNPVAAIPSLHAGLPLLIALCLIRVRGRWALPLLLYPLLMTFFIVYLGEHYVIDALFGFAAALAAYLVVYHVPWTRLFREVRVPRPAPARWTASPSLRRAGQWLMPALALISAALIVDSLRPGTSQSLIPGLGVLAGTSDELDPQPCELGSSSSLTAGALLAPVAGRYAAFFVNVDEPACFVLTANTQFAPPSPGLVQGLARRAPIRLRPLPSLREGVEYFSVYTGFPSPSLVAKGLPEGHRFALVVALSDVPDAEAATAAIDHLAQIAFTEADLGNAPSDFIAPVQTPPEPPEP